MRATDPVWIENPPEIYVEDGTIHVCEQSGGASFHMVMEPHTFLASVEKAMRVYREWETEQG